MPAYITLKALAHELGMDRSHLRKYVLKQGIEIQKVRSPDTLNQLGLALSESDAEAIRALRIEWGWGDVTKPIENSHGCFYIVQVAPDLDPLRIKLGFAADVQARLEDHRCVSPTAELVRAWPCRRSWETAAMASASRHGCRLIKNEVFTCDALEEVVGQAEAFFALMPPP